MKHKTIRISKNHPHINNHGHILIYRLKAEKALGKYINPKHPIHHHENELIICENEQYHKLLHQRTKALKICGYANWRKCQYCKQYDDIKNLSIPKCDNLYHKLCAANYRQIKRRSQ